MLTRADQTVADAEVRLREALDAGVTHVGFKDVGLPPAALKGLASAIRSAGARAYLEVVSAGAEAEAASARIALDLGVDALLGGVRPDLVLPLIAGSALRYFPYPGVVRGHPCILEGSADDIARSARTLASTPGVHGLNLLAYRYAGDAPGLMRRVREAVPDRPLIIAGSLDRAERLEAVVAVGAAAFTVGTAALDGVFPAGPALKDQLAYILAVRDRAALSASS